MKIRPASKNDHDAIWSILGPTIAAGETYTLPRNMSREAATGRGIARRMCEHSLDLARSSGFHAMQFNFAVSTNVRAVQRWESLGFHKVGQLPFVMCRDL